MPTSPPREPLRSTCRAVTAAPRVPGPSGPLADPDLPGASVTLAAPAQRGPGRLPATSRARRVAAVLAGFALAAGCGVPRTVIPSAPSPESIPAPVPVESGFLTDYAKLKPSEQFPALRIWRDDARTGGYRRLHVRPVEVWRGADKRLEDVSEEDLQYLADALYRAIRERLSKSFEIVEQPAAGVLDIHLGFTLVTEPDQKIDFFSTAVPVRNISRREGPLLDGTRRFVRDCALEIEFSELDRSAPVVRGKSRRSVRAAFFDARRDGDTPKGTVNTWEDVHAVFAKWAGVLDERLEALRDGTFKPKLTVRED